MDGTGVGRAPSQEGPGLGGDPRSGAITAPTSDPQTIVDVLQARGAADPDAVTYKFLQNGEREVSRLTARALDSRARAIASGLIALGARGKRVLLVFPQGPDFPLGFFGTLYAGAVAVPAPSPQGSRAARARLAAVVQDARPAAVLTTPDLIAEVTAAIGAQGFAIPVSDLPTLETQAPANQGTPPPNPEDLALIQYTSGSTGNPRGVMITHANIRHNQDLIRERFQHEPGNVMVGWLPMFHDMGLIGNLLQPAYVGFEAVLMTPLAFLQEPVRWLRAIQAYGGTSSGGPNFAYDYCVDRITEDQKADLDLSSWAIAFNGAEPVRATTLERFAQAFEPFGFRASTFYPCYGMAEATLLIAGVDKAAEPTIREVSDPDDPTRTRRPVGCGRGGLGQEILIVDPDTGTPLAPGEVGEIWLAGGSVAAGYWNNPKATAAAFHASPAGLDDPRYLRTGDLGFLADGELYVTGRIKDVIIVRGRNHYPQDIEATVQACHQALRTDCGAALTIDRNGTSALIVIQEVDRSVMRDPPVAEIAGAIRAAVSDGHGLHVAGVVLLRPGGIPKTSSGKIQRRLSRERYLAHDLPVIGESVHGPPLRPENSKSPAPDAAPAST